MLNGSAGLFLALWVTVANGSGTVEIRSGLDYYSNWFDLNPIIS